MKTSRPAKALTACIAAMLLTGAVACSSSDKGDGVDESTTTTAAAPATDSSTAPTDNSGDPQDLADLPESQRDCVLRFFGLANTTDFAMASNTEQLQAVADEPDCASAFATLAVGDYSGSDWFQALNPEAQEWFKNNQ